MRTHQGQTLSISAAADFIEELKGHRLNRATVYRWALKGTLPCFRIGNRLLTTRAAVLQLLESFNAPNAPALPSANEPRADVKQAGEEAAARISGMEV